MAAPQPEWIGAYRVLGTLGRGGMGVVYEVRDPQLPRPLALKQILGGAERPRALARFLREAALLAKIQHRNVVRIHDLGRSPQGPFLVQELLSGEPLGDVVARGPLEPREAARIVRDVAAGVCAVHAQGVLHRDLKPDNVFLGADGIPVLLDFGLARDLNAEALTLTGEVLGTPGLMAPEQAEGANPEALDERVDVYGLGALLYVLLTGQKPFRGATAYNVLLKVLREEPRWPAELRPGVPLSLDRICRAAMAKSRDDRLPSAQALHDALEQFLSPAGPRSSSGSRVETSERSTRRAVGVAGVGLALAATAALAVSVSLRSAPPTPLPKVEPRRPRPAKSSEEPAPPRPPGLKEPPPWFHELSSDERPPRLPAALSYSRTPREYLNDPDGSRLVWVPPGTYRVGWQEVAGADGLPEIPPHVIQLERGFFLGKFEVTWEQYLAFSEESGAPAPRSRVLMRPIEAQIRVKDAPNSETFTPPAHHPVVHVTWTDAVLYCSWAGLRLPTDVEWELAARGPKLNPFPWGYALPTPEHSNLYLTGDPVPFTAPVGSFPLDRAPCGAMDMSGNVAEWTQDTYFKDWAPASDGSADEREGSYRAWRAGSWKATTPALRPSAHRRGRGTESPAQWLGFRVARSLD